MYSYDPAIEEHMHRKVNPPQSHLTEAAVDAVQLAEMGLWDYKLVDLEDPQTGECPTVREFIDAFKLQEFIHKLHEFADQFDKSNPSGMPDHVCDYCFREDCDPQTCPDYWEYMRETTSRQ